MRTNSDYNFPAVHREGSVRHVERHCSK